MCLSCSFRLESGLNQLVYYVIKHIIQGALMGTKQETADYILGIIHPAGEVTARKMFGEYSIYCDGKIVALVSDEQLYVKPTESGRAYLQDVEEAPPYPGAKNWFFISEDKWDDTAWLVELIRITTTEVPIPKPKKKKAKPG